MIYMIYTTEGCTYGPNSSVEVDNCQVLGTIEANSEISAIMKLFKQNEWIRKAGFSQDNAFVRPLINREIVKDIQTVIDYLWDDEYRNFQENHCVNNHIFETLLRLKKELPHNDFG